MTLLLRELGPQPGVLLLTLNRVAHRNALSKPLLSALDQALQDANADPAVKCVVITGAGVRAFSAGADIHEQTGFTPPVAYAHMRWGQELFNRLAQLTKPTIAAINGFALGGGFELALACDFRTASDTAQVGLPEVTLASLPGWGGTQRLTRLIGASEAKLMAMTGRRLDAQRCLQLGVVNAVYPAADCVTQTLALAGSIAAHSAQSLAAIKQVVDEGLDQPWAKALDAEARAVERLWGSPEQKRAQAAFFASRDTRPDDRGGA
jgi:enoyl-CoA hydratase/carnithine racemase